MTGLPARSWQGVQDTLFGGQSILMQQVRSAICAPLIGSEDKVLEAVLPLTGEEAWDLVRYLTTNTHFLAQFSNGIRNVPSTKASLHAKEIKPDAHFATFLKIFGNPYSSTSPITAAGVSYTNAVQTFATKWQAGKVSNLSGGLASLDKQLDAMVKQAGGGGVPG